MRNHNIMKPLMSFPPPQVQIFPSTPFSQTCLPNAKSETEFHINTKLEVKLVSRVLIFTFLDSKLLRCTLSWTEWRHEPSVSQVCTALCHLSLARPIVLNLQKHTVGATKITLLPVPCHMFRPGHSHSTPNANICPFIRSLNHNNKLITCDPHLTENSWHCMSDDNLHLKMAAWWDQDTATSTDTRKLFYLCRLRWYLGVSTLQIYFATWCTTTQLLFQQNALVFIKSTRYYNLHFLSLYP
jgi:hypothetical protein